MNFLAIEQVAFAWTAGTPVVQAVDLALREGEVHCLVGRSGCGKTTLLKLAAGLLEPASGRVRLRGRAPAQARADIGFVFQSPTLLEWQRMIDNVLLPVSLQRTPSAGDRAHAQALLERLGLAGLERRYPRELSGGQQSRVALARALLPRPALLLLDEPFAALDAITREDLQQDLLHMAAAEGSTVLFVTHDIAEAVFLGDRVSVMEAGRLVRTLDIGLPRPRAAALRGSAAFAAFGRQVRQAMDLPVEAP